MYNPHHIKSQQKDRFSKLFRKLNTSYQGSVNLTQPAQQSTDNSFYADHSVGYSQQTSVKNLTNITPYKQRSNNKLSVAYDEQSVLQVLFSTQSVLINRQKHLIKTQFIPTSNGLRYILTFSNDFYLNLSWLHSVQSLEKNKLLILYYDMYDLLKQPKIQSLIIQFYKQTDMIKILNAINYIHNKSHDKDVQKLYHLNC